MIPSFTPASDIVPANLDATSWAQLEPLYRELIGRELHCKNCLERLILDRSEVDAAASEAGSSLYITMTCHTDNDAANKAYLAFVENVQPHLKRVAFELDKKIAQSPLASELPPARYAVLLRDLRASVELFRDENVAIETELAKLDQEYSQVCGAMSVQFQGQERTMPMMARFQEDQDRATREAAWRAVAERRLADRTRIDDIYDKMLALRQRVASNAGFADYRAYAFKARRRFDYGVRECDDFAKGVERSIVPALRRLNQQRRDGLGLARLRPWDLAVDPKGRAPLRPFDGAEQLVERSSRLFHRMEPSLGGLFDSMRSGDCLDLETRKGKAPGGYQSTRDRRRLPFIFMNAAGVQRDVETMVHEAGHAFHALLSRPENILAYREAPIEFCEVASMSMELTSYPFLDEFYAGSDADRARRVHMEQLATMIPWIAIIDQFQHWIYTNPGHTRDQRTAAWRELMDRFYADVDWTGIEDARDALWHRQLHLFGMPFYYIEYGIAQLGALQLYGRYRRNPGDAIAKYKEALTLGGSKPLPELFKAAGLDFDFSPERIASAWAEVESQLATLPA